MDLEIDGKNIFIITVDALRADFLGYMGGIAHTPNLDKLSKDCIVFNNAIAPGSYTFVSFPSFMTSLYPSDFFIKNGNVDTIAESLNNLGYQTVSFNSNPHAKGKLDRGFSFFDDLIDESEFNKPKERLKRRTAKIIGKQSRLFRYMGKFLHSMSSNIALPYATAEAMNIKAFDWLDNYSHEKPLFFWMHYMDPHYPYISHSNDKDISKKEIIRLNRACRLYLAQKNDTNKKYLSDDDLEKLKTLYKNDIEYVDFHIGNFLDYLKENGFYEEAHILFFSDHGEMFGEQGKYAHKPFNVYYPQLHVPFLIKTSKYENMFYNEPVLLFDIPKTILELIKKDEEKEIKDQLSILEREFIISEGFKPDQIQKDGVIQPNEITFSCICGNWQLIHNKNKLFTQLFNIEKDPFCSTDLKTEHKELTSELLKIIEKHQEEANKKMILKNKIEKVSL